MTEETVSHRPELITSVHSNTQHICKTQELIIEESTVPKRIDFASASFLGLFIPDANLSASKARWWEAWGSKSKMVLLGTCVVAALTFIANLTIAFVFRSKYETPAGSFEGELFRGDCGFAARLDAGIHVAINILSTLLLSASNLCMQLLLAPTRELVDNVHRNKQWLDIGIPSFRNFRHVELRKKVVWMLLAISSLPLHFVYNSVVYQTRPSMLYQSLVVTSDYLTGARPNATKAIETFQARSNRTMYALSQGPHPTMKEMSLSGFEEGMSRYCIQDDCVVGQSWTNLNRLDPVDCLSAFSEAFGDRSGAIMVSSFDLLNNVSIPKSSNPLLYSRVSGVLDNTGLTDNPWLCGFTNVFDCRQPRIWNEHPDIVQDWNVFGWKIDYCLVSHAERNKTCAVKYSFPILIAVCCANALKLLCICYTASIFSREKLHTKPLTTLGDALQSFLEDPDPTTKNRCQQAKQRLISKSPLFWDTDEPQEWKQCPAPWHQSPSFRRWCYTMIPLLSVLVAGGGLLGLSIYYTYTRSGDKKHIFSIGIGEVDQATLGTLGLNIWEKTRARYAIIMFANMWQFFVSVLNIQCNALLTCFCVEAEWQSYGIKRKGLRVSSPKGLQRSTYFVSIPLKYGLNLMAVFSIFHWILSRSVFLTEVESIHPANNAVQNNLPLLASSPRAIIIAIVLGTAIVLGIILISLKTQPGILPAGGTCSAIISASCHRPKEDKEAHLFPVQWGEVPEERHPYSKAVIQEDDVIRSPASDTPAQQASDEQQNTHTQPDEIITSTKRSRAELIVGHCCFTTAASVQLPESGRSYA